MIRVTPGKSPRSHQNNGEQGNGVGIFYVWVKEQRSSLMSSRGSNEKSFCSVLEKISSDGGIPWTKERSWEQPPAVRFLLKNETCQQTTSALFSAVAVTVKLLIGKILDNAAE